MCVCAVKNRSKESDLATGAVALHVAVPRVVVAVPPKSLRFIRFEINYVHYVLLIFCRSGNSFPSVMTATVHLD